MLHPAPRLRGFVVRGGFPRKRAIWASEAWVIVGRVEIVLRTGTADGVEVVLSALVYAKILKEHAAVADLALIDRTIREPDERRPDVRPRRERFFCREGGIRVLAVVEFGEVLPSS